MTMLKILYSSCAYFSGTIEATHSLSRVGAKKALKPATKMASASSALLSIKSSTWESVDRIEKGGRDSSVQWAWGRE